MYDIKNLSRESNSTALIMPHTKFEAIISKDVGGDRFQANTHALQQIKDSGRYNFLPVALMVMILVFLKSQCRELSKNLYFYLLLTYSFRAMILSSKACHHTLKLMTPPPLLRRCAEGDTFQTKTHGSHERTWK